MGKRVGQYGRIGGLTDISADSVTKMFCIETGCTNQTDDDDARCADHSPQKLRAENKRLRAAVTDLGVAHIQAQTEVERLRAALQEYLNRHPCSHQIRCWSDERARAMFGRDTE